MVPRVFVSSTYYDLKHVRERIEKFIENYGFEPVLFESDRVTYQFNKEIDQSAYFEVSLCHIMILIIGGRYGSLSSQAKLEEERKKYDDNFISITRKEFETAILKNIPILIFIDKNVYTEYQTYKENQEFFDNVYAKNNSIIKDKKLFKFANVDHINVFKFIDIVRTKPVKTFEKVEEIENYVKAQFSGMFYLYLESLKKASENNKILDTVTELNSVTLRMNEMISSMGKQILGKNENEYKKVIDIQFSIILDFYEEQFRNSISFINSIPEKIYNNINFNEIARYIYENALIAKFDPIPKAMTYSEEVKFLKLQEYNIIAKINDYLGKIDENIGIKSFKLAKMKEVFENKVLPFINNKSNEELFLKRIETVLDWMLYPTPF